MSLKVLVLSRNYPNNVTPYLGLWVDGLVHHLREFCEVRVMAPVPYCPPLPGFVEHTCFRPVLSRRDVNGVEVWHPRFLTGPGYSLHSVEAGLYYRGVRRQVEQLRREFPFDLLHAHFSYPDGVVAARLGRHYRVPVLITEHAPWLPWMERYPRVRRQAVWASGESALLIAGSRYVRDTILHFTGEAERVRVIPIGVDGSVFTPPLEGGRDPDQVLYVGRIHFVKGVDVLLRAMRRLIHRRPKTRLVLVGGSFFRDHRLQEGRLRRLAGDLGLEGHVTFVGMRSQREVAGYMRESALLVLPSRAESFGAVLVEALACGTPVVATRCGGPEDIVTEEVGALVPAEDPEALARGIEGILENRERYHPMRLRTYALERFAWERVVRRTLDVYGEVLERWRRGGTQIAAR